MIIQIYIMKRILFAAVIVLGFVVQGWGQEESKMFEKIAAQLIDKQKKETVLNTNKLVSNKAFNQILTEEFNKVQTGGDFKNVTNRYANLDLNKDKKTFSFSPYIQEFGRGRLGIDFSGTLNNDNNFDFNDRNQVSVGLNYTLYIGSKKFKDKPNGDIYTKIYEKAKEEVLNNGSKLKLDDKVSIDIEREIAAKDSTAFKRELEGKFVEYEIEMAKNRWTSKKLWWLTFNFTPIKRDNFRYIINEDADSYTDPYSKSIHVVSVSVSGNWFYENNWIIFNPSLNFALSNKHSLSEIYSTQQWNKISQLSGETFLSEDSKNVYVLSDNKFSKLLLADWSIKSVLLVKDYNFGLDINYSNISFITPNTSNGKSKINEFSVGIIIPFEDSKGKNTINIVPFYSYKQFIDYEKSSENNFGVKFNIPLG